MVSKFAEFNLDHFLEIWIRKDTRAWNQAGLFFPRKVTDIVGMLDERLHYAMDFDFICRALSETTIRTIENRISRFRIHKNAKTFFIENSLLETIYVVRCHLRSLSLKRKISYSILLSAFTMKRAKCYLFRNDFGSFNKYFLESIICANILLLPTVLLISYQKLYALLKKPYFFKKLPP